MSDETPTDAEIVEEARRQMQANFDEGIRAFDRGKSLDEFLTESAMPFEVKTVAAADIREVGFFDLDIPERYSVPRRQWVYVTRATGSDGAMYVISWRTRLMLQKLGFAKIPALVNDPRAQN